MINTDRFILKPISLEDVNANYLSWFDNYADVKYIDTAKEFGSIQKLQNYVKEKIALDNVLFLAIKTKDNKHIGNIKFEPIDFANNSAVLGILIGDLAWRGKGVAKEVIAACENYLYQKYNISNFYLGVDPQNIPAVKSYTKLGYVEHKSLKYKTTMLHQLVTNTLNKFALGTAQFGLDYGVANKSGQVDLSAAKSIIETARLNGLDTIDTAISYGNSEKVLGEIGVSDFKVISKIPKLDINKLDICKIDNVLNNIDNLVNASLQRLKITSMEGLLLHSAQDLLTDKDNKLYKNIEKLKSSNLVKNIGVSVYNPKEAFDIIARYPIDIIQIPFNLFDRRLVDSGLYETLQSKNIKIHVRSVFLQGLLLISNHQYPVYFARWKNLFTRYYQWLENNNISAYEACINFVLNYQAIDKIIIGCDNLEQFKQLITVSAAVARSAQQEEFLVEELGDLVNPSSWVV